MEHELAVLMDFDIGHLEPATPTSIDNMAVSDFNNTDTIVTSNMDDGHKLEELLVLGNSWLVGWLVVFGLRPFETVFQSISGHLPKRGRKRRERIEESKNVQTTPHPHLL